MRHETGHEPRFVDDASVSNYRAGVSAAGEFRWFELDAAGRERLREAVGRVLSREPWIQAAYLFGSAARGDRASRDLDIGLVADPIPSDWTLEQRLAVELAEALERPGVEIDLRILNDGDPVFLHAVLTDGELLFERCRETRVRFEARALARWLDFRPVWERLRERVLRTWSDGCIQALPAAGDDRSPRDLRGNGPA